MGSRSTARKLAMQLLYQAELRKIEIKTVLEDLSHNESYPETTKNWAKEISQKAWEIRKKSDLFINDAAVDWSIERISIIDKSILRLALAELSLTDTHYKIVINESVELAKDFSEKAAAAFINGILGKFIELKSCSPE